MALTQQKRDFMDFVDQVPHATPCWL